MWNIKYMVIIPVITGTTGTVRKVCKERFGRHICRPIDSLQKTAVLRTLHTYNTESVAM
jgi:hypothetical protein